MVEKTADKKWCIASALQSGTAAVSSRAETWSSQAAAQEVVLPVPASRASNNSAGASERSACQPRQRQAKCDAASIGCSIPLSQENAIRQPGGYTSDHEFHGVDYANMANEINGFTEEGNKEIPWKTHRGIRSAVFRKKSGIIARKFGIINYCFCGRKGKEGGPGQIGGINGQGSEAVLNRGIIPHGKTCAKIILISGRVNR